MSQKVKGYMLLVYKNMEDRPQMSRVIRYWMIDLIEMTRLSRDTGKILWLSSKLRLDKKTSKEAVCVLSSRR